MKNTKTNIGYGDFFHSIEENEGLVLSVNNPAHAASPENIELKSLASKTPIEDKNHEEKVLEDNTLFENGSFLGQLTLGNSSFQLNAGEPAGDSSFASFDDAFRRIILNNEGHWAISGDPLAGNLFEIVSISLNQSIHTGLVITADMAEHISALVLNGTHLFMPANLFNRNSRWVEIPRAAMFYALPRAEQVSYRQQFIDVLNYGVRTYPDIVKWEGEPPQNLSMPVLRLMVALYPRIIRLRRIVRNGEHRGYAVFGISKPITGYPVDEPDVYIDVISQVEGTLDSINAWDHKAGISLGPIQINAQRGSLLRFLYKVWTDDRALFNEIFSTPLLWTMRQVDSVIELVVNGGTSNEFVLRGTNNSGDIKRVYAYLQSGNPDNHRVSQIDPSFRRRLIVQFRKLVCWPHIQEYLIDISLWFLDPGLRIIESEGIPPLQPQRPDQDTFVLKSMLMSAYVRYPGCLRSWLRQLHKWTGVRDKLAHWHDALSRTTAVCQRLRPRLESQRNHALHVFAHIGTPVSENAQMSISPAISAENHRAEIIEHKDNVSGKMLNEADKGIHDRNSFKELFKTMVHDEETPWSPDHILLEALRMNNPQCQFEEDEVGIKHIYNAFVYESNEEDCSLIHKTFEKVAGPGECLHGLVQEGDILIHCPPGESYARNISIISDVGERRNSSDELGEDFGFMFNVIQGGINPGSVANACVAKLSEGKPMLNMAQLLLRMR